MKVSVALCTYNGERFLKTQIDSILNQTVLVNEIVVCDDGSTDSTHAILREYKKAHPDIFRIYINETNLRSVKNFEKTLCLCKNEIIFLCDQDDQWCPNKVEQTLKFFKNHQQTAVMASNGYAMNEHGIVMEKYSLWDVPRLLRDEGLEVDYFKIISYVSNIATGASMAIRKEYLNHLLPFPTVEGLHHDEWIALISSYEHTFGILDEKLFYYREHSSQQVGGVFFDKNDDKKTFLIQFFDLSFKHKDFSSLKKMIKKLSKSHHKSKAIMANVKDKENFHFIEKNMSVIEEEYRAVKKIMAEHYPVRYFFLSITDKILHKRQLKS